MGRGFDPHQAHQFTMNDDTVIVVDCMAICYQIGYSTQAKGLPLKNSIVYGFLSRILDMGEMFETNQIIFCFDSSFSKRKELLGTYKQERKANLSTSQKAVRSAVHEQSRFLQHTLLPAMGFRNILCEHGLEADDLIAKLVLNPLPDFVIASQDEDLYQCLAPNVRMYKPRSNKEYTYKQFKKEWGLDPKDWAEVKAIAGCKSDNIKGIDGVGEKTAAKYLRGEKIKDALLERINSNTEFIDRNFEITALPHPDTPEWKIREDDFHADVFAEVAKTLPFFEKTMWRWKRFFSGRFQIQVAAMPTMEKQEVPSAFTPKIRRKK